MFSRISLSAILLVLSATSAIAQTPAEQIRSKTATTTIERVERNKSNQKVHRPTPFSDKDDRRKQLDPPKGGAPAETRSGSTR